MILNKIKSTEKIVRMIEADNTVVFETPLKIKKPEIKSEGCQCQYLYQKK
jgi:ribosomal protein L23